MNNEIELTAALLTIEKCRELSGCPAGVDLQDWVKQLAAERDAGLNAEHVWETAMMEVCGEDGPASVANEIRSLRDLRDTAIQALKSQVERLAAENLALKQAESNLVRNIINDLGDTEFQYARVHTPATDRILAEAEARGIEKGIAHLENKFSNIGVQIMNLQWLADSLREGADK